jgi:Kef-type K+ transport system membrane component KefB
VVSSLSIEITVLLFAAMLGVVISKRLGQSAIVGEILLGVLIGPTVLHWVSYDNSVRLLAELGAIFMLFTIGLECDVKQLSRPRSGIVALCGVLVPFVLGWWIASIFGYTTTESLFLATSLTATSIAVTANILRERGVLQSEVAATIIGAAVVDDVLGLIALAIISALHTDASGWSVALQSVIAIGFVLFAVALIKPVQWVLRKLPSWTRTTDQTVTLFGAMVVAFGYAGLASLIGLSSIVGAFLAGVTLEHFEDRQMRSSAKSIEVLFSAIFFVSLGVAADFRALGAVWIFAAVLLVVAVVSKLVGCGLGALVSGHSVTDATTIGLAMVPRGEVAMIVGLLGLSAGVIGDGLFAAIVFVAFLTTILTPVLLRENLSRSATT